MNRRIHFIGVGGIGMSGLAEILLNLGYEVSGSDLSSSPITERLEEYGLLFSEGHAATNIGNSGIVVVSAAVSEENCEVAEARKNGIPVLHRSELLADLMRLKPNAVAVGGTHGKTTTTSMISAIMDRANIGATSIIGGILHRSGTNARWGTGDFLVAEADEHDGSFLRLHPTICVVTNIDAEHLEYYGTVDRIKKAFTDFCNRVPFYGYSIVCWDDANARSILGDVESNCITYGLDEGASLVAENIRLSAHDESLSKAVQLSSMCTEFDIVNHDERLGRTGRLGTLRVNALGLNGVRNALAACAVGLCLDMTYPIIHQGLRTFDGIQRRMQVRGEARGVVVVEDYAHHPTELASTLEAVRWIKPKRVICVFQPHLYSRTKFFAEDFAKVLSSADRSIVTGIYPSREEPMPGVHAGIIVDAAIANGADNVQLLKDMNQVPDAIADDLCEGDLVLILGAGDINHVVEPLLDRLRQTE